MKLQAETLRNKFAQNTQFEAEEVNKDIETVMTFDDGHRIVRMLTPASLKKETAFMGHCIGQGGYDDAVIGDARRFYSLRDPQNKPHATFEVETENNRLHQCKGKNNTSPVEKYFPYVQGFVKRERFKLTEKTLHTGLIEQDGEYYDVFNLPPDFAVDGDLSYYTQEGIKRPFTLPEGLKVTGHLSLFSCTGLTALPEELEVKGIIYTDFGHFNDVASARRVFEEKFGTPAPQTSQRPVTTALAL